MRLDKPQYYGNKGKEYPDRPNKYKVPLIHMKYKGHTACTVGAFNPEIATDESEVTCKNCARKLNTKTRIQVLRERNLNARIHETIQLKEA